MAADVSVTASNSKRRFRLRPGRSKLSRERVRLMAQTTAFRIRSIIFGFEGIFGRGTFPFGAESCTDPGRDLALFGGTILKNAMQSYKSKLSHFFCKLLLYLRNKIPLLGTKTLLNSLL